jgi:nucleotide sugar dehydrogenase
MQNIGIIGLGFVGGAIKHSFKKHFSIKSYDIDPKKCNVASIKILVKQCKYIFITLPTPMNEDGSCNLDIIDNSLNEINIYADGNIVIIKSSVPPGTTQLFSEKYPNINITFSPEFLTERNANQDFEKQEHIIVGGKLSITTQVKNIFAKVFPLIEIRETDPTTAEMVKFTINCFLASKISLFNELYQFCDKLNISYSDMLGLALFDKRIGDSHTAVPGWDEHFGFGGSCFPANVNIMIAKAKELGIDAKMLKATWSKNIEMRPEKDWEQLRGRCIK